MTGAKNGDNKRALILMLNGVSSAGKTTLARAVQQLMDEPYYLMGNDLFFDMLPEKFCDADWREAEYQALCLMARTAAVFSDCKNPSYWTRFS